MKIFIKLLVIIIVITAAAAGYFFYQKNLPPAPVEYRNNEYGFNFSLPETWKGYSVIIAKWEGGYASGPIISIRHPLWTSENPRQDIPIMVLTLEQWMDLQQDKFHIGAAPIGPSELSRNSRYVFALPARYNYAFPAGFEEVDQIIQYKPLKTF